MPDAETPTNHKNRARSPRSCCSIVLTLFTVTQTTAWAGDAIPPSKVIRLPATSQPAIVKPSGALRSLPLNDHQQTVKQTIPTAIEDSQIRRNPYTDSQSQIDTRPLRFPAVEPALNAGFNAMSTGQHGLLVDDGQMEAAGQANCEPFSAPWHLDFSPTPMPMPEWEHDSSEEQRVYDDKNPVPVQRPLLELGRDFYGSGIRPPSETWLGKTNLVHQQLYLYGDYRTGIAAGRNQAGRIDNWASRLNLDFDYRLTSTERFHMFVGPLNQAANNTNVSLVDEQVQFNDFYDFIPVTGFFEGDLGAIAGGLNGGSSPAEIPVTIGLVPLLFQNGIWMEDAVTGFAFAIPAKHSRLLNWSNFDATFFAIFDQLNSPAFGADANAAQAFGTAWFIDAYGGYIETGYAYLNDRQDLGRSYHNATFSFTRRYFDRISNSVRVITNSGQDLDKDQRTADGALLLIENSWVTSKPMNVIPYWNAFAGWDRPQSVARAGVSGGVLRSTGLNFEPDGLNGHPILDDTAADTFGGAVGIDLIGNNFDRQFILEAAYVSPHGNRAIANGEQYGLGTRYQWAMTHNVIIRLDGMYGWQRDDTDVYGTRIEYRWKF